MRRAHKFGAILAPTEDSQRCSDACCKVAIDAVRKVPDAIPLPGTGGWTRLLALAAASPLMLELTYNHLALCAFCCGVALAGCEACMQLLLTPFSSLGLLHTSPAPPPPYKPPNHSAHLLLCWLGFRFMPLLPIPMMRENPMITFRD